MRFYFTDKAISLLIIFILLLLMSPISGINTLLLKNNSFQVGDQIIKQQVEYKDPGSSGRDLSWDFSMVQSVNDDYVIDIFIPDSSRMDTLCVGEHNTRYYYQTRNDTLFSLGFENSTTKIDYTTPELRLKFPFSIGDTLHSEFIGFGEYGHYQEISLKGFTKVVADATGKIVLPNSVILNDVLRIRTYRHYTQIGRDSLEMSIDSYAWYSKKYRYPVFESTKTTLNRKGDQKTEFGESFKDTTIFNTSFYFPPDLQILQVDSVSDINATNNISDVNLIFTQASFQPNPVETTLYIKYKLTQSAKIWFSVHNSIGLPIIQTTPKSQSEGFNFETINLSGQMTGAYELYVHVDDKVIREVILKK